ncbi:hypothetical protein C8N43_0292 [Litoreibacter ponti]|uniref:Uncharacterized protein n=1 Tax=Litoreibacter ponti TaxID=1510457 RepID=A0A2T6BHV7_9RHOB|nr:hypothetical protein [Litoreibacter ponti]PTX55653.1 hypothetical protein C8N43_0292 [Litoreibacter ponti]
MNFEALDGTKLIILMVAGAVFAAVGLYLMVRPKAGDAAKIELFGMKFESSSAGLLVFIVGAAFLATPLFAPEKSGGGDDNSAQAGVADPSKPPALRLPSYPEVEEQEPNDRAQAANIVAFGQTVAGSSRAKEADWFILELPPDPPEKVTIRVRHVDGGSVSYEIFDQDEVRKTSSSLSTGAKPHEFYVDGATQYFVRLKSYWETERTSYELQMTAARGE